MKRITIISLGTFLLVSFLTMGLAAAKNNIKLEDTGAGITTQSATTPNVAEVKINSDNGEVTVKCPSGKCPRINEADLPDDPELKATITIYKGSCYVCSGGSCYNAC